MLIRDRLGEDFPTPGPAGAGLHRVFRTTLLEKAKAWGEHRGTPAPAARPSLLDH